MMDRPNRIPDAAGLGGRRGRLDATVLDVVLALALCLPVACLTPTPWFWPSALGRASLGPLDGAIRPEVIGSALVACASLLALALALGARAARRPRGAGMYLGAGLCTWVAARGATDTFELARAELLLAATFALLWSGAALGQRGLLVFARGLVFLSLVLTGGALLAAALGHPAGLAGALGNTGSISEAALAGAAIGALAWARERGPWSWVGLAAVGAFGAHVGSAPVLAGALSLGVGLALGLVLLGSERKRLAVAALVCGAAFATGFLARGSVLEPAADRAPPASVGGGIEVRQRLWTSVSDLVAEHPLGVGAGQFAASFPPYRDPIEIELSSHRRRLWQETEVEHAHADVLQFTAEGGLVGGALFAGFLVLVGLALRRSLVARDAHAPFALAAFALVVNGLARTPLTWNPASAAIGFTLFGVLLARDFPTTDVRWRLSRWVGWTALALLASRLPSALALIRHEHALRASFASLAGPAAEPGLTEPSVAASRAAVAAALEWRPDSPLAHAHAARLDASTGATPERVRSHWRALLRSRPASIEGLVQDGVFAIRTGLPGEARARWERVVALDPDHPIARRNLLRVAAEFDDVAGIQEHARALQGADRLSESFVLEVSAAAAARGQRASVEVLLAFVVDTTAAEVLHALAEREDAAGHTSTALGLRAAAHRRWATEHAVAGAWERTVRSLREARSAAVGVLGTASGPFEREYAAALIRAGRDAEAREVLAALEPVSAASSPEGPIAAWAEEALAELETAPR